MLTLPTVIFFSLFTGLGAKLVVLPCDRHLFQTNIQLCLSEFNGSMEWTGFRDGCPWPGVKSTYFKLQQCVDGWAKRSWCKGVGTLVDDVFLDVHQTYFSVCGQVQDPPLTTLFMLVSPVIIATVFLPLLCVSLTTANKT